jgi:large subunit ribosomal protein L29
VGNKGINKRVQPLVDMSAEELAVHAGELREELFNLRFKNRMRTLDNPVRIRSVRRQVARAETLLSQRAQQAAKEKAR